ncbi:hypothetical protein N7517_007248 [Penicillium concentricum]|uniref:Uncharacterized protein n=1 Tax=Penicillium concentricum TaxID=293559 RepID=A0A9W9SBS9_9EURO|nr:uncharacterized protein N7517_007248 [Penicillium concentricum]KAJ5375242.1 hypothetical protein N7517_007248 [Penicillium concentricum]
MSIATQDSAERPHSGYSPAITAVETKHIRLQLDKERNQKERTRPADDMASEDLSHSLPCTIPFASLLSP